MFISHHREDGSSEDTEKDSGEDFICADAFSVNTKKKTKKNKKHFSKLLLWCPESSVVKPVSVREGEKTTPRLNEPQCSGTLQYQTST